LETALLSSQEYSCAFPIRTVEKTGTELFQDPITVSESEHLSVLPTGTKALTKKTSHTAKPFKKLTTQPPAHCP